MLVLRRKRGERIMLSNGVTITLNWAWNDRAQIGIDAPPDVRILREELINGENGNRGSVGDPGDRGA